MDGPWTTESRNADRWIDFDTLVAERAERLSAAGWGRRDAPGSFEASVRRFFQSACDAPADIVRMAGGRMDFQDKLTELDRKFEVRYRIRLRDAEPIFLEDLQAFLDWVRENRPELKAFVERERLAADAPEPRSSPIGRASRSL